MKKKHEDADWVALENEYVTDLGKKPCTLKQLAVKYGLSYDGVRHYAASHKWSDKRRNYRTTITQKTSEKVADIVSDQAAEVIAQHLRLSSDLLAVLEKAVSNPKEMFTYVERIRSGTGGQFSEEFMAKVLDVLNDNKLLNVVNALEKLQRMQRQTLGIMDRKDEEQLAMARQKMLSDDGAESEDDGFMEALNSAAAAVWDDEVTE